MWQRMWRPPRPAVRGYLLVSCFVLVIVAGIVSAAQLTQARLLALSDESESETALILVAGNAGIHLCKALMAYESPDEFISYADEPPPYPGGGNAVIINGIAVTWTVQWDDEEQMQKVLVRAGNITRAARLAQDYRMKSLGRFAFASNNFGDNRTLRRTHWYGNVYWYTPTGLAPKFHGLQTFHGRLFSRPFRAGANEQGHYLSDYDPTHELDYQSPSFKRWQFVESSTGNVIPFAAVYPKNLGPNSGSIIHYEHALDDPDFVPFDDPLDLAMLFAADPSVPGYEHSYRANADAILSTSQELFLSPDGQILVRNLGRRTWTPLTHAVTGAPLNQNNARLVIFSEGDVWVRGAVTGRVTVAAQQDMYINGNILRKNNGCALGLIARRDIAFENRKEWTAEDGDPTTRYILESQMVRASCDTVRTVSTSPASPAFVAKPAFDISPGGKISGTMMTLYENIRATADWVPDEEWRFWNGQTQAGVQCAGALPPFARIEASMYAARTAGVVIPSDEAIYEGRVHRHRATHTTSRIVLSGTYFFREQWDSLEIWWNITYDAHPRAEVVVPPMFMNLYRGGAEVVKGTYFVEWE